MKKNISLMLLILALVGCQSKESFSEAQIAAMKRAGFTQNREGWGLGLSDKILFGVNESELTLSSKSNIQGMAKTWRRPVLSMCELTGTPIITANQIITNSCR